MLDGLSVVVVRLIGRTPVVHDLVDLRIPLNVRNVRDLGDLHAGRDRVVLVTVGLMREDTIAVLLLH